MSDYSALEKLAYNATPGPWTAYDTHGKRFIERVGTEDHVVCETPKRQWLRDSEYIAAANPLTILGLIEENRLAQSELAALREELAEIRKAVPNSTREIVDLRKSLTAAEQRNVVLVDLLRATSSPVVDGELFTMERFQARANARTYLAALEKPTESGASE